MEYCKKWPDFFLTDDVPTRIFTVYPKKYAHGFCFAVLCCGYTLTDYPISIRLTSLALWQSNDCPSASKATLMNMDIYFMWIHYERLHNNNKAKHNKTMCIFLAVWCTCNLQLRRCLLCCTCDKYTQWNHISKQFISLHNRIKEFARWIKVMVIATLYILSSMFFMDHM